MANTSENTLRSSSPLLFAITGAAAMMAHQVGAKAVRDSLFLSAFDVTNLPAMVIAASLFSLALVFPASWLTTKLTPGRVVPVLFVFGAAFFLLVWRFGNVYPRATTVAIFLEVAVAGSLFTSGFWSLVSETLDPRSVKKYVGKIGAGGSAGILIGGVLAERVGAVMGVSAMLLVLAALHGICAALTRGLGKSAPMPAGGEARPRPSEPPRSLLRLFGDAPYLRILAALVLIGAVSAGMIDYVLKAEASAQFEDKEALLRFFAVFYSTVGLLTLLVQSLISKASLDRIGLAKTIGTFPLALVAGGLWAIALPGLVTAILARGAEAVFRGSLFRSGYELFYSPIRTEEKRAAKPIIDVGFDKLGDALAGGAVKLILILAPLAALRLMLTVAVVLGLIGVWIALQLQEAYLRVLEKNLIHRRRQIRTEQPGDSLLVSVMITESSERIPKPETAAPEEPVDVRPLAAELIDLHSSDRARVRRVLRKRGELSPALVPHVIGLLARDSVYQEAVEVLRGVSHIHTGQLTDALLDQRNSEAVRRRIPRILSALPAQRNMDGLLLGLGDESFDVREQCGHQLLAISKANPDIAVPADTVYAAVRNEISLARLVWGAFRPAGASGADRTADLVEDILRGAGKQVLDHIFRLLGLVLPREPLRLAYRGLRSDDLHLRGTALEYLDGVMPREAKTVLWPYLEDEQTKNRRRLAPDEALKELLRSSRASPPSGGKS